MKHRGEIVERAVRSSGMSITKLSRRIGFSRRHMYNMFDAKDLPIDVILDIGRIIHYDFSVDFPEIAQPARYKKDLPNNVINDPGYIEGYRNEIKYLKDLLKEKDRIIKLLEEEIKRIRKDD